MVLKSALTMNLGNKYIAKPERRLSPQRRPVSGSGSRDKERAKVNALLNLNLDVESSGSSSSSSSGGGSVVDVNDWQAFPSGDDYDNSGGGSGVVDGDGVGGERGGFVIYIIVKLLYFKSF